MTSRVATRAVVTTSLALALSVPLIPVTGCESDYAQEEPIPDEGPPTDDEPAPDEDLPEDCDPSYPDACIPSPPADLDCADVDETDFSVEGDDPHGFDADGDGVGCESY